MNCYLSITQTLSTAVSVLAPYNSITLTQTVYNNLKYKI
jgi:hypothetical protein